MSTTSVKKQIEQDLKTALLGGDKVLATTLRGLKSVILYAEVSAGKRDTGLTDAEITDLLRKEAKKRQESADLFAKGGNQEKAQAELAELKVIEQYLPQQLSDEQLQTLVDQAISELGAVSQGNLGQVIGRVKALSSGAADGARIAAAVKQRMA